MAQEVVKNLDVACNMLRESFWVKGQFGKPVMQDFDSELFLDKENVKRMAAAVATNLRNGYSNLEVDDATSEQIKAYAKEVKLIKTQFNRGVKYHVSKVYDLDPEKAEKFELKNEIKDEINDLSKGII